MNDLEKDKLKAGLLKQCYEEVKKAKLIVNQKEQDATLEKIHNEYQTMLLKLGISSWTALVNFEDTSKDKPEEE